MDAGNLSLIAQLADSMSLAVDELEKALAGKNVERVKKAKDEIIKFQQQISQELKE